jgi:hypothetical protein
MSSKGSDPEHDFFLTGAELYLEIEEAVAEFRRQVQEKCRRVVEGRLDEIGQACQMEWTSNALSDYKYGWPEGRHIGKQLSIKSFGNLYFCLDLYRENGSIVYLALVYLYRRNAGLAAGLWPLLGTSPAAGGYREGNNLYFGRWMTKDQVPDFEEFLNGAVDDFIAFISKGGGLKKHI